MAADSERKLPESVWEGFDYTSVHAVILVLGIENITSISGTITPQAYDQLMYDFQESILGLLDKLRSDRYPVAEIHLAGSEVYVYFYDKDEVAKNYELDGPDRITGSKRSQVIAHCRESNSNLAISALRTAILIKNLWLTQPANMERVRFHLEPYELGIGMHYGRVFLRTRPGGARQIEGYPINFAFQLKLLSRKGRYSHIMVSQKLHDMLLRIIIKHTQIRQRVAFHGHEAQPHFLPGADRVFHFFELRLYHRIGVHIPKTVIDQYEAVFALDRANLWAYYQLIDYYAYTAHDWMRVYDLAKLAHLLHPQDEKAVLDLAKYYLHVGKFEQSRKCAEKALEINPQFDLAHEHLAIIADKTKDIAAQIRHWRDAVYLCPESPVNNFNLGLALLLNDQTEEGYHFVQEALRIYPEYPEWQVFREALNELKNKDKLPELLVVYTYFEDDQANPAG